VVMHVKVWATAVIVGVLAGHALADDPKTVGAGDLNSQAKALARESPGASISIARRVVDAAGVLERYARQAMAVRPQFDGAGSVSAALMTSAAYEPARLEEGVVAYAALVALQEPTFVAALSSQAQGPADRAAFARSLMEQPALVMQTPGAAKAAALAAAALNRMGSGLVDSGRSLKQAAFDIQRQSWSSELVSKPAERLADVKAQGQASSGLNAAETETLLSHVVAARGGANDVSATIAPSGAVLRGLALAAVAMVGQAGENRTEALSPLLADPTTGGCLRRAKLNLHQCLAAAGPQFEDVYCAGVHAMAETGQCLVEASGAKGADGVKVPIASAVSAESVAVPIAAVAPAAPPPAASPNAR
jgi:hypothetical protein